MWIFRETKIQLWSLGKPIFKENMLINTLKVLKMQADKIYWYIYDDLNYFEEK